MRIWGWLKALGFVVAGGLMWMMQIHPEDAESIAAAWLDTFGVASWGKGFTSLTDDYIVAGCCLLLLAFLVAFLIPWLRRKHSTRSRLSPQHTVRAAPPNCWRTPIKRLRWELAQRREPQPVMVDPGTTSLGDLSASMEVQVVSLPKPWRNPIKWFIWKKTGSTKHL